MLQFKCVCLCLAIFATDPKKDQTVRLGGVRRPFVFCTNTDLIKNLFAMVSNTGTHPRTIIVSLGQRLDLYLELFGRHQWKHGCHRGNYRTAIHLLRVCRVTRPNLQSWWVYQPLYNLLQPLEPMQLWADDAKTAISRSRTVYCNLWE